MYVRYLRFQTGGINSFIAKTVNESSFVILGGDFNEDDSCRCASFKKSLDLGLVNSLSRSPFAKMPTWCNFHGAFKTIDYVLVSSNLINVIVYHSVDDVGNFFNTDHSVVSISVAIDRRIESFELDKGHTIRSVLERPFQKVVLDHLMVDKELILEPEPVRSKVDEIIEGWTKKHAVVSDISNDWA
ncbi:hypothetical protein G9A89_001940 [Geosiphon pyriformis]|nr:hypothetical protein G9A89_001940 [Geosiphon pyriformis]